MIDFVKSLLHEHMELDGAEEIEIMRAHRSPATIRKDAPNLLPIHVYSDTAVYPGECSEMSERQPVQWFFAFYFG